MCPDTCCMDQALLRMDIPVTNHCNADYWDAWLNTSSLKQNCQNFIDNFKIIFFVVNYFYVHHSPHNKDMSRTDIPHYFLFNISKPEHNAWKFAMIYSKAVVYKKSSVGELTHWGQVTHICVGTNTTIGSDIGLSPGRRQAIIWTNAGILLIGPLGTNFSGILSEIHTFSFKKMHFKTSSAK